MIIDLNRPITYQILYELISKARSASAIWMPREIYREIWKTFTPYGDNYHLIDKLEEGGQILGVNILIYDIKQREVEMPKKFIQKAVKRMEEKGTKGSFTRMAKKAGGVKKGGGIKDEFIDKELKSPNPKTRKKAQFAKNMKKIARGK